MPEIRIYVEGGGNARHQKQQIRQGFNDFFKDLRERGRTRRVRWNLVACGSRNDAFEDFRAALSDHPDAINILLVDSEDPIAEGIGPWRHLSERDPSWKASDPSVSDEHYHLMVQVMEAWLIADLEKVEDYYGPDFNRNAIPANRNVEAIPKATLIDGLTEATRRTQKGAYKKIKHAADLLKLIRPEEVRRLTYCDRLFQQIERLVGIGDQR